MNALELSPNTLASLIAIADHGSMSAAARYRNVTQPSLSRQIQDLEMRIGAQVVERSAHGTRLTPAGEILVEKARDILALLSALPEQVRRREGEVGGRVRLGTVDSVGIYLLPPLLARFINENPRIEVEVDCQSSPDLVTRLLADELDIAIATMDHPKLNSELLFQHRLVLAYPAGTPMSKVPHTLGEMVQARVVTFPKSLTIRRLLDQACERQGLTLEPVMELASVEAIKAMVRAGLGVAVVPEGCVQGFELETTYIDDLKIQRSVRMLTRSQGVSLAAQRLMDSLRGLRNL
jgi:LysR family transcriptional regulator, cyn operon transcriptional activator